MLQRTKVDQVLPVYSKFIKRFPTISSISQAPENEILLYFKKLGLLWRAMSLKKMADYVLEKHNGIIPKNKKDLVKIPAIGEYISDAVLSFAFDQRAIVIDSNVCRTVMRIYGLKLGGEIRKSKTIYELANKMLPAGEKSRFLNLAFIDHAALICRPFKPICTECPINGCCNYYLAMRAGQFLG